MEYRCYRSADKPNVFLGIRGRLSALLGLGVGAGLVLGFLVGALAGQLLGAALGVVVVALTYLALQIIQDRYSDKECGKLLIGGRFKNSFVDAPRRRIARYWGGLGAEGAGLSLHDLEG